MKNIEPNSIDIVSIIIITNWEKEKSIQQEQKLFCHMECLRKRLSKNVPLYIAE